MSKRSKYLIISILSFLGLSALAAGSLPFSFKAGEPIKADEVNANFQALADGKQTTITNSPCGEGQFVTGVGTDGKLSCGVDQIGSAGSSGVSSLNGKTGSLAIEGGDGVTVETAEDGKVTISAAVSTGGDLNPQATIGIPSSGTGNFAGAAFSIKNNNTQNFISAVAGTANASGAFGVYGSSTAGQGVRGNASSGSGVVGTSTTGMGVRGSTTGGTAGVYGLNTSGRVQSAGVNGQNDASGAFGVYGSSGNGFGTAGITNTGTGVLGQVNSTSAGITSAGVSGVNAGTAGYGVRGEHKGNGYGVYGTAPQVGVGGESAFVGVYGKAPVAMNAVGNAVQSMGSFGWAKAMIHVKDRTIVKCFNSQVSVALMQSNGCGFTINGFGIFSGYANEGTINFGFNVTNTFPMLTMGHECDGDESSRNCAGHVQIVAPNSIRVFTSDLDDDWTAGQEFFLILF